MFSVCPTQNATPTTTVAESCESFGAELHAAFVRKPHWIAPHIAPTSNESFDKYCTEPERAIRFPLGLAITALRVLIRREGIASAQRILDIVLRPLGLVTVPAEDRAPALRNIEQEMLDVQIAASRLFVRVSDAISDGKVDEKERRAIREQVTTTQNELEDIKVVMA